MPKSPFDPASGALQRANDFRLLRAVTRGELAADQIERLRGWDLSAVGGDFLRLAEYHGVLPLAARNLTEHGRGLSPEVEALLRSGYEANLKRSLWFTAELVSIMRHLESRQVRAVPYKGPMLAQAIYGDFALRSFSDLDFLVVAADFGRAKRALSEIGYHPSAEIAEGLERLWLCTGYERSLDGPAGQHLVELQWALLPYFYAVDLPIASLLQRAVRTSMGGREMLCLAPEDSLLALCLHGAKHLWARLLWVADIAETVRRQTIDYKVVTERARASGVERILGVSLWLAQNVLSVELPELAQAVIRADSSIALLGAEFAARLSNGTGYGFESTEYFRLIFKLRERTVDRGRYLWRLLWTPGDADVAAIRLPEILFPLYRIVRLGRLIGKLSVL
jgi:hypothetical protein